MSYLDTANSLSNLATSMAESRLETKDEEDNKKSLIQSTIDRFESQAGIAGATELGAVTLRKGVDYAKSIRTKLKGAGAGEAGAGTEAGTAEAAEARKVLVAKAEPVQEATASETVDLGKDLNPTEASGELEAIPEATNVATVPSAMATAGAEAATAAGTGEAATAGAAGAEAAGAVAADAGLLEGLGALAGSAGAFGATALSVAPELVGVAALGYGLYSGIEALKHNHHLHQVEKQDRDANKAEAATAAGSLRSAAAGIASRNTTVTPYAQGTQKNIGS